MNQQADMLAAGSFARDGYLVVRGLCPQDLLKTMERVARSHLDPVLGPVEYEAEWRYTPPDPECLHPGPRLPALVRREGGG
jgi:hypothetical protein